MQITLTMPKKLFDDKNFNGEQKMFYGVLHDLWQAEGYAWPTNAALCKRVGKSDRVITYWLTLLENAGYIRRAVGTGPRGGRKRRLIYPSEVYKNADAEPVGPVINARKKMRVSQRKFFLSSKCPWFSTPIPRKKLRMNFNRYILKNLIYKTPPSPNLPMVAEIKGKGGQEMQGRPAPATHIANILPTTPATPRRRPRRSIEERMEELETQVKAAKFPAPAEGALLSWFNYRGGRGRQIDCDALIACARRCVEQFGVEALCETVEKSRAAGYAGIAWPNINYVPPLKKESGNTARKQQKEQNSEHLQDYGALT